MIELGRLGRKEQRPTVRFRDWVEKYKGEGREEYPVRLILLPQKYPSGALIFTAEFEGQLVDVKLTVKAETLKEILKATGIKRKGQDIDGKQIWLIMDWKEGKYGVDIKEAEGTYVFKGTYYIWQEISDIIEVEEDIQL